jgi:hypothetical protein
MTSYANSFCKNVTAKDIRLDYFTTLLKSYIIADDHSSIVKCKYVPLQLRTLLVEEIRIGVDEQKIQYLGGLCSYIEKSAKEQLFYQKIVSIVGDYICTNMMQIQHPLAISFKKEYLIETGKLSQDDVKFFITRYNYYKNNDLEETSIFSSIFNSGTPAPTDSILKRSVCNMGWKLVIVFVKFAAKSVFDNLDDSEGENLHKKLISQQADLLAKQRTNIEALLDETLNNNPLRMDDQEETCFTDDDASTIVETECNEQNNTIDKEIFIGENNDVAIHENTNDKHEYYDYIGEEDSDMNTDPVHDLSIHIEPNLSPKINLNLDTRVEPCFNVYSEPEDELHTDTDLDPRVEPRFNVYSETEDELHTDTDMDPRVEPRFNVYSEPEDELHTDTDIDPRVEPCFNVYSEPEDELHTDTDIDPRVEPNYDIEPVIDRSDLLNSIKLISEEYFEQQEKRDDDKYTFMF